MFRLIDPPMSVVSRDAEEMGAVAAGILMRRLADRSSLPERQVLPTKFIARGSTGPPLGQPGHRPLGKGRALKEITCKYRSRGDEASDVVVALEGFAAR